MNCLECNKITKDRKGKRFCSSKCRNNWKYNNIDEYRDNKLDNYKLESLKREKMVINNLIEGCSVVPFDKDTQLLFKLIYK